MAATPKRKAAKSAAVPPTPVADSAAVESYLRALKHPRKAEVEALRAIILRADARIAEGIKWNAPSFHCVDWFATFDLRSPDWVQIVLHRGAKAKAAKGSRYVKDPEGILKWITDDRCLARFASGAEVTAKAAAFAKIVAAWAQHLCDDAENA